MFSPEIQKIISTYLIWGLIPLDKVLHVIVGAALTIGLLWLGMKLKNVFISLALICVVKEIIDYQTLESTILEGILDILFSFTYMAVLVITVKIKKHLQKASRADSSQK